MFLLCFQFVKGCIFDLRHVTHVHKVCLTNGKHRATA